MSYLAALGLVWLAWVLLNLLAMAVAPRGDEPNFNGFTVHMPEGLRGLLDQDEWAAIRLHEEGHRARLHVWKNFARVALLAGRPSAKNRIRQEFEADDHAADRGYADPLARALLKMSAGAVDSVRARRLLNRDEADGFASKKGRREAGDPTGRDARETPQGEESK